MNEETLKYKKRINSQLILTDEEREEIAKRVIEFMKSCLSISNYINEPENKYQTRYRTYSFGFAGYTLGSWNYFRIYEKDGEFEELTDETLLNHFMEIGGMFQRFKYFIRMNGSLVHIKKLIEILGKDVAISYFDFWAKQNTMVALRLNGVIQELLKEVQGEGK